MRIVGVVSSVARIATDGYRIVVTLFAGAYFVKFMVSKESPFRKKPGDNE